MTTNADFTDDGRMTQDEVRAIIADYERCFGMSSDEFLRQWQAGTAPDTRETNDWATLLDWA